MRTPKRAQSKKLERSRISKKKYKSRMVGLKNNTINPSGVNLDNLSEVIRCNRSKQAEGRGSWKIVPKDSCEIYKARRKRQQSEEIDETMSENSDNTQEEIPKRERKKPKRKPPKKKKREPPKKYKPGLKNDKRRRK